MKNRSLSGMADRRPVPGLLGLMIFLVSGCTYWGIGNGKSDLPVARQGLLDLRAVDLQRQTLALNGTWKWYWQSLRKPGDPETRFEFTRFPQRWTLHTWQGNPIPAYGYATYALTVLLPPNRPKLALFLPDAYTSYRLFLNQNELAHSGFPGTNRQTTTPFWSTQVQPIPSTGDTLRLLLQVANFQHSKGGVYKSIRLGPVDTLQLTLQRDRSLTFFLTGCLFMGGLFFLGLFWFGRHEISMLYFSLFCLLYSYRVIGTDHYALHSLFQDTAWSLTLHLEYLSLFLGVLVFVLYTGSLYPADVNPWIIRGMALICALFSAITIVFPPTVFTRLINPFLGLMFLYITYAFYIYWLAARRNRPGAIYSLMSTGVLLAVFIMIIFKYFQIAYPENLVLFVGYVSFFFLQSLVLSYRFAFNLQQARNQAEEGLRAKNEFLSTISHEIRTPLNAVLGMTQLLEQDKPRPDQKPHLDSILFSARNLLHIVNDILDFNRMDAVGITMESVLMNPASILTNIASTYRPAADEKGLHLNVSIDPAFQNQVIGDPTRLAQVLTHLVDNALKFTQEGKVRLSLVVDAQTDSSITVTFAVDDTGIGIAPEKQELIFNRFTQADSSHSRSYGGTGLGLSISHRILQLQGTELHLSSAPGKGSRFYFTQTFPKVPPSPKTMTETKSGPGEKPLKDICILLVEDNAMNVILAKSVLERLGATVDVANNGREAVDMLDSTRHQLVLMDLQMPVMDGFEATRIMRERRETLPIIAVTASLAQDVGEEARRAGLDEVLVKPYNTGTLTRMILHHLSRSE
ncbi:ATP-binding protein [Larkinella sp. VNQ87]|uniref:ATP-binding protein n=1 Tax=Larkinella sp. VNQ87 TaxID=3400921 RepID=UPI003C0277A3